MRSIPRVLRIPGLAAKKTTRTVSPSVLLEDRMSTELQSRMSTGGSAIAIAEASGTLGSRALARDRTCNKKTQVSTERV